MAVERNCLDLWTKLEEEGMKLNQKLSRSSQLSAADAERLHKDARDFQGRLQAALAAAKVQKDSLTKWITENVPQ